MWHAGLLFDRQAPPHSAARVPAPEWPAHLATLAQRAQDPRLRRFYAAGAVPGSTPLQDVPLMALDVETTGLDPARDGIVSVGLVPMDLQRVRASEMQQWLLKPRAPLTADAIALHGITPARVSQAPDLQDILEPLLAAMAGHVMVVHCRDIERQFFNSALQRRLGEDLEFPVIDTMELEARLHRRPAPPWWRTLWQRPPPPVSIRLMPSRQRYGLPRYRLHHAPTDALATAELLQAQIAHRYSPHTAVAELWC